MTVHSACAFAAAVSSGALALGVSLRKERTIASWFFCAGMTVLAVESALLGIGSGASAADSIQHWQTVILRARSFLPGLWLCFSLTYSRGNAREFLQRARWLVVAAFVAPIGLAFFGGSNFFQVLPAADDTWWISYGALAKTLTGLLLIGTVLILMNLERTLRAAVGTMQWRIKFTVLGLAVIFGSRIYMQSQALVYSGDAVAHFAVESTALLIGCALIALGYFRGGFGEIDIYPSRAALHTSITVLLAGGYLVIVGILAQIAARTGGGASFQLQALIVLLALPLLAVLLLSKRLRQRIAQLISRHFKRPEHDFRKVWSRFTVCTGKILDRFALCSAAAGLISETFNALSVTIWLLDEREERLTFAASTSQLSATTNLPATEVVRAGLGAITQPFDLEKAEGGLSEALRAISEPQFQSGGDRICVPLRSSDHALGLIVLADRVNGSGYSLEELDLLKCIGDQVASSLLNLQLTDQVMKSRELEAFQTMSAFFVHDLKNAASTLGLMLQNLPVHFDDPAFRQDALRGIGRTADRINQLIQSLTVVRQNLNLKPAELDLNALVNATLEELNGASAVSLVKDLQPLPKVLADGEQLQSVITNLLVNAREAVAERGTVTVKTLHRGGAVCVSVADDGCGMSPAFVRDSLFRPFSSTKKKGLGIGMFQSKMIVEAHGGNIQVTSDLNKGTTFTVFLPLKPASA